jgi:prevent-host-death family protein
MAKIGATEFKARCLEIMDLVAERRESYVITKRGRPVARLTPVERDTKKDIFGCMAGHTEVADGLERPLLTDEQWRGFLDQTAAQVAAPRRSKARGRRPKGARR